MIRVSAAGVVNRKGVSQVGVVNRKGVSQVGVVNRKGVSQVGVKLCSYAFTHYSELPSYRDTIHIVEKFVNFLKVSITTQL